MIETFDGNYIESKLHNGCGEPDYTLLPMVVFYRHLYDTCKSEFRSISVIFERLAAV